MTVDTKATEIKLGNIRELRGNFKEITRETEEGTITEYECDYFRTTGNDTFEQLYARDMIPKLQRFLDDTDYIYSKCEEENLDVNVVYADTIQKRKEARAEIQRLEEVK
jgi:hypothetical protein